MCRLSKSQFIYFLHVQYENSEGKALILSVVMQDICSVVKLPVTNVAGNLPVINACFTRKLPVSYP